MAISTNQKPSIYRNLYDNTDPDVYKRQILTSYVGPSTERVTYL